MYRAEEYLHEFEPGGIDGSVVEVNPWVCLSPKSDRFAFVTANVVQHYVDNPGSCHQVLDRPLHDPHYSERKCS